MLNQTLTCIRIVRQRRETIEKNRALSSIEPLIRRLATPRLHLKLFSFTGKISIDKRGSNKFMEITCRRNKKGLTI
jgi:hypothetical protein